MQQIFLSHFPELIQRRLPAFPDGCLRFSFPDLFDQHIIAGKKREEGLHKKFIQSSNIVDQHEFGGCKKRQWQAAVIIFGCLEIILLLCPQELIYTPDKITFMQQVKSGDTVKVHYHGRLADGTTFDSSAGRDPLEFQVGSGAVIAGFDNGVTGMIVGEKKTIQIPVEQAYGPKDPSMVVEFPKANFPEDMEPEVGMQLNMTNGTGQVIPVVIIAVGQENVTLDANHPLAGHDLIFDIELVEIGGGASRIILP